MLTIYDRMVMDYSSWLARLEIGAVVMRITIPVVGATQSSLAYGISAGILVTQPWAQWITVTDSY